MFYDLSKNECNSISGGLLVINPDTTDYWSIWQGADLLNYDFGLSSDSDSAPQATGEPSDVIHLPDINLVSTAPDYPVIAPPNATPEQIKMAIELRLAFETGDNYNATQNPDGSWSAVVATPATIDQNNFHSIKDQLSALWFGKPEIDVYNKLMTLTWAFDKYGIDVASQGINLADSYDRYTTFVGPHATADAFASFVNLDYKITSFGVDSLSSNYDIFNEAESILSAVDFSYWSDVGLSGSSLFLTDDFLIDEFIDLIENGVII